MSRKWSLGLAVSLLELIAIGAMGVAASSFIGLPAGIGTAFLGIFIGSVFWHNAIKPRFLSRFKRHDLPRISPALDGIAATAAAS